MKYLVEIQEIQQIQDPRLKKIEPLAGLTKNPDIEADSQFSDDLSALIESPKTSTFAIPFLSQLRNTSEKLRRSLKLRIDYNKKQELRKQENSVQNDTNLVQGENSVQNDDSKNSVQNDDSENSVQNDDSETFVSFDVNQTDEQKQDSKVNPKVGEYWTIRNGKSQFRYVIIVSEDPLEVKVG
jgi:hypothetical protein